MSRDYFQTKDGIINLVLLVLNTIGFISIVSVVTTSVGNAFMVATILGFCITGAFCLAHFFGFTEKVSWPWSYMEIIYTEIWMLYYFIITGFILSTGIISYIAAGIFGFITALAYLVKGLQIYVTRIAVEATAVYVRQ